MFSQKKQQTEDERLDRLGRAALRAVRMSEAEVEAVAEAEDLYARLRQRIAAEARQRANGGMQAGRWWARLVASIGRHGVSAWRRPLWPLAAAAAVLVLLALLVPRWLQMPAPESPQTASYPPSPPVRVSPVPAPKSVIQNQTGQKSTNEIARASGLKPDRTMRPRSVRGHSLKTESATEFIPLMYWPEASALESSRVVRIKVPRATLVSFGLPMNAARAGELVNAEVVLGDDGLARAIRFIY